MEERFDAEVELAAIRIHMPKTSPLRLLFTQGRGAVARVEADGISMRQRRSASKPLLFAIRRLEFRIDVGTLRDEQIVVPRVTLEGAEVNIPPKGERPALPSSSVSGSASRVLLREVRISELKLSILPRDPKKIPLRFDIHNLRFESTGAGQPMKYQAALVNPKPPGTIDSFGTFGPWNREEPSETPIAGKYTFENADLGVFRAIAGTLRSTGDFSGSISSISARGEAYVADFRLKMAGNPVPLRTNFDVLVDGTNGNTVLRPVRATLGRTRFTTSGGVIKHEGEQRRAVSLEVHMPAGDLRDLLRLAMKGAPFMEGQIALKTRIDIPPLSGKVREKLILDGKFTIQNGKFLRSTVQEQLDSLSRRGQGEPKNEDIDQVVSNMRGSFRLEEEVITFREFRFGVPGAIVDLKGDYNIQSDQIAFKGALKLDARVSETMSGWKRWALKPVDPLFAKKGAGTFLPIKVEGTSREPKFGLNFRDRDDQARARKP